MSCHLWKLLSGSRTTCLKEVFQFCSWYIGLELFKKKLFTCLKTASTTLVLCWHPQFRNVSTRIKLMAFVHFQSRKNGGKETQQEVICPDVYFLSFRSVRRRDQMFKAIRSEGKCQDRCCNTFCPELLLLHQCSWSNFLLMALNVWSVSFASSNTEKSKSWIPYRAQGKESAMPTGMARSRTRFEWPFTSWEVMIAEKPLHNKTHLPSKWDVYCSPIIKGEVLFKGREVQRMDSLSCYVPLGQFQ